jgi:hypothetical protein
MRGLQREIKLACNGWNGRARFFDLFINVHLRIE